jgi:hypothetical protein
MKSLIEKITEYLYLFIFVSFCYGGHLFYEYVLGLNVTIIELKSLEDSYILLKSDNDFLVDKNLEFQQKIKEFNTRHPYGVLSHVNFNDVAKVCLITLTLIGVGYFGYSIVSVYNMNNSNTVTSVNELATMLNDLTIHINSNQSNILSSIDNLPTQEMLKSSLVTSNQLLLKTLSTFNVELWKVKIK